MAVHHGLIGAYALAAACGEVALMSAGDISSGASHNKYEGRVCGRDNGKPERQIQKRNSPCMCGSGLKAKKCCVYVPKQE